MKKLFIFASLCFFAFTSKAQELNFDETVKYISDKIECCAAPESTWAGSGIKKIECNKNGLIKIIHKNEDPFYFNLFDLFQGHAPHSPLNEDDDTYGFGYDDSNISIRFNLSSTTQTYIRMNTSEDAMRLTKAFRNLKKLCTKEKDPFDK